MLEPIGAVIEVLEESLKKYIEKFRMLEATEETDEQKRNKELLQLRQIIKGAITRIEKENEKWSELLRIVKGERLKEETEIYNIFIKTSSFIETIQERYDVFELISLRVLPTSKQPDKVTTTNVRQDIEQPLLRPKLPDIEVPRFDENPIRWTAF